MPLPTDFAFRPLPPLSELEAIHEPFAGLLNPLGPLAVLPGTWSGAGFNVIWRPFNQPKGQDRFLELNLTSEDITFEAIGGPIPNRGLLQQDINMFGLTYMQRINDANLGAGLHIEPGIWAAVPPTTDPPEPATVVRMASIPHGTAILAQGTATVSSGGPTIPDVGIKPFQIGNEGATLDFPEQDLNTPSQFRSDASQIVGVNQAIVDNPNSVLQNAIAGQQIVSTTTLSITTEPAPVEGGGTANTAFLDGTADGPNARAATVRATFWIEEVQLPSGGTHLQLQYSQFVALNFNGLTWPHITVGTLQKHPNLTIEQRPFDPNILKLDPTRFLHPNG